MATIKLLFLCFFILMVTIKFTSCQGQSNGTQVTTTEKPDDDETTETTEANDESDSDNETESESESENEDSEDETTEKPKKSEESEKSESKKKSDEKKEKPEKEDELDLEDDPIPEPRCLARYNNLNCTEAQRQSAISNYKATRGQLVQTLLQSGNSPSRSNNTTDTVSIISVPSNINSTQVFNVTSSPSLNSTASSSSSSSSSSSFSSSSSSTTTTVSSITSGVSSCNRAVQLLANVDKYVRFNDSCSARVFGKRNNPDYWIARCMKSLRRHH